MITGVFTKIRNWSELPSTDGEIMIKNGYSFSNKGQKYNILLR